MNTYTRLSLTAVLFAFVSFVQIASGSPVHTPTFVHDGSGTDPSFMTSLGPASNTDLIDDASSSFLSQSTTGFPTTPGTFFGDPTALNDGTLGTSTFGPDNVFDDTDNIYTTTFTLDTSVNDLGYSITEIKSHSGYAGPRVGQHYKVYYTTVSNGTFQLLTEVSFNHGVSGEYQSTRIDVTDTTGLLATGVNAIRFEILLPTDSLGTSYREFDVFGVATVPEPAGAGLALAMTALIGLKRRRA